MVEGVRGHRGVTTGCLARDAVGFLIAGHEGCSDGRGVIPGNLFRDAVGFLFASLKAVAMVEELSPVISFETRWAFPSLLKIHSEYKGEIEVRLVMNTVAM